MATKNYDWADVVKEAEGEDFFKPPVQYEFSNGRKFVEQPNSGVYETP